MRERFIIGNFYRFYLQGGILFQGECLSITDDNVKIFDTKSGMKVVIYFSDIKSCVEVQDD